MSDRKNVHTNLPTGVRHVPQAEHRCPPPRYRPRSEWRSITVPPGGLPPKDRGKDERLFMPTAYPPGTVWRCGCGWAWVRHTPLLGRTEGGWTPLRWYHLKLRRQTAIDDTRDAYEAAAQIVKSWK